MLSRAMAYGLWLLMLCFSNSAHVMFSTEFAFCLFINYAKVARERTGIGRHLKETILWSTITWSEMGKQTYELKWSIQK